VDVSAQLVTVTDSRSSAQTFGSFATGLHLPTSDVDCSIVDDALDASTAANALRALGNLLRPKSWVKDLEVCSTAAMLVQHDPCCALTATPTATPTATRTATSQ
jgi:DNA polymerase sigma